MPSSRVVAFALDSAPNGWRLSCGRPVMELSVDRRTPPSQAQPGGRRPWKSERQPKRAAVSCSRRLLGGESCEAGHSEPLCGEVLVCMKRGPLDMNEHSENTDERTGARTAAAHHGLTSRECRTGLAVEGPGFLVWDEVASDARRRAAELSAVAR